MVFIYKFMYVVYMYYIFEFFYDPRWKEEEIILPSNLAGLGLWHYWLILKI